MALQQQNEVISRAEAVILLSLSPSSGVGFYWSNHELFRSDLITEEMERVENTDAGPAVHEFGLVRAALTFESFPELRTFAIQEFVREKKQVYYEALFTRDIPEPLRMDMLDFLNDPALVATLCSLDFVQDIVTRANPALVSVARFEAESRRFQNVLRCFDSELAALPRPLSARPTPRPPVPPPLELFGIPSSTWMPDARDLDLLAWNSLALAATGAQYPEEHARYLAPRPAQGDREAFESIYTRVRRVVSRMVPRNPNDPENDDRVQDVILRLFSLARRGRIALGEPPERYFNYLVHRVCSTTILDSARSMHAMKRGGSERTGISSIMNVPDPSQDIESQILANEHRALLEQAIAQLPEKEQKVLRLWAEGERSSTIAESLGLTHVAVHRTRVNAIRQLQRTLSKYRSYSLPKGGG
jgi:RNA polymerase sigma factor (sigma-70 family)